MVDSFIQTTDVVPPCDYWSYWKDTVLAAVDCHRIGEETPFKARRSVTSLTGGMIFDTTSSPLSVDRSARGIARDHIDYAALTVFVEGHGLADPRNIGGTPLATGDVAFHDVARPHRGTALSPYRELRLYVPRAAFSAKVGPIDELLDLRLSATAPLTTLFTSYLRSLCDALPSLTRQEADAGLDGALHLLSGLVASHPDRRNCRKGHPSSGSVMSLADRHIAALLEDPTFNVEKLARAIGMSRAALYRTFAERGGVAAAIRDARLDRAYRRLVAPADRHRTLAEVACACGFTEYANFSRAFRHRFGMTPRDARATGQLGHPTHHGFSSLA